MNYVSGSLESRGKSVESALHSFTPAPRALVLFQAGVQDRCALNGSTGAETRRFAQTQV